jgi:hypothetical protein
MLIHCEPPFLIYRLQWLDFERAATDESRYKAALNQLLPTIEKIAQGTAPSHKTGELEPLNFDLYLALKTEDFIGREWLTSELSDALSAPMPSKTLLLVGDPGWGKTAFAGQLFATNPNGQLLAAHFCRADRIDTVDPYRFVQSIAAMTALRVPAYASRLTGVLNKGRKFSDVTETFEILFFGLIAEVDPISLGRSPRYLLVDGLDETFTSNGSSPLARLLSRASGLFPDHLRLVVTTRDAFGVVEAFSSSTVIRLCNDDPRNRADLSHLIASRLQKADVRSASNVDTTLLRSTLVTTIGSKANGNALVASQLTAAVSRGGLDTELVAAVPRDLSALYRALLERRVDPRSEEWTGIREIFELVLATDTALPISLAAAVRNDDAEYGTRKLIYFVSDLLVTLDDSVQVFHQTLRDFLTVKSNPFFVNAEVGAKRLLNFALTEEKAAALSAAIVTFCRRQLISWLVVSKSAQDYHEKLLEIYSVALPARVFNAAIGATYMSEQDKEIVRSYARSDLTTDLLEVPRSILKAALDAMNASGISRWLNRVAPKTEKDEQLKIMNNLFKSISLTGFSLEWLQEVFRLAPHSARDISKILEGSDYLRYVFRRLDLGIGSDAVGISRAFEDYGTLMYRHWNELAQAVKTST